MKDFSVKIVGLFILLLGLYLSGTFWSHINVHGILSHFIDPSGFID